MRFLVWILIHTIYRVRVSGMDHIPEEGRVIVVDLDLERFFDRVNHDILMARLARRVELDRVSRGNDDFHCE